MASLIRRVSRNGEAVWYVVYNDAAGKQQWVRGYSDKRETQRLGNHLEDEKRKILNGEVNVKEAARRNDRVRPVEDHLKEYQASLEAPGNSGNHVSYTLADIRKFFAHTLLEHAEVVTRPHVDQWVMSLKAAGKDSMATINRRVGSLKAFLKALHQRGTLTEYVLYRYPKMKTLGVERRRRRALTLVEQRKLLKSAPSPRNDIYRFALLTGARYTQMSSLTVGKVSFKSRTMVLQAKDNRHRNREHVIPLHPDLLGMLKKRCDQKAGDALVFDDLPGRFEAATLVRRDCSEAGVDVTHIDFHALRHSFITTLAAANVHPKVVQQLAGHASIETTLKHYTHFKTPDERAALALLCLV